MDAIERQYLHAMFCLSGAGKQITMASLATQARLRLEHVALATVRLGRAGLIDRDRLRLTMRGLAVAATFADLGSEGRDMVAVTHHWGRSTSPPARTN